MKIQWNTSARRRRGFTYSLFYFSSPDTRGRLCLSLPEAGAFIIYSDSKTTSSVSLQLLAMAFDCYALRLQRSEHRVPSLRMQRSGMWQSVKAPSNSPGGGRLWVTVCKSNLIVFRLCESAFGRMWQSVVS